MNDRSKDSLENFFKEGAQNYNFEFNEGDWQKLEAQLDQVMPVASSFKIFLKKYWPAGLIIILMPVALLWYGVNKTNVVEEGSLQKNESLQDQLEFASDVQQKTELDVSAENIKNSLKTNPEEVSDSEPLTTTYDSEVENTAAYQSISRNNVSASEKINTAITTSNRSVQATGGTIDQKGADSENMLVLRDNTETYSCASENERTISVNTRELEPIGPELGRVFTPYPLEVVSNTEILPVQTEKFRVSLYLGAGFSPDFSTVGLGNFVSPGFRWAFTPELALSKRFLINTGIVWVNNKYEAYGEDYHAPSRYWQNGIVADEAYGECVMIDIPLNIRYNVLLKGRHQMFLSGGMSTYFLLKEDYYFHYEEEDPDLPHYWGTDKLSTYPFKIVNFSVGYQYLFGRKGSLQVEPFIKIPTAGVGWGKVDLHTIGIYFMYKYKLGK